jgi:hypothetical protein
MPATYLKLGDNPYPPSNILLRSNDDGTFSICTGNVGVEVEQFRFRTDGSLLGVKPMTLTKLTSGSGTYNTPATCVRLVVRMVGGGGGGMATNGAPGGGTTTFGTNLLIARGGAGGAWGNISGDGIINAPAFGIAFKGEDANNSTHMDAPNYMPGGKGGCTPFGGGGRGMINAVGGPAAVNSGSGGGGGGSNGYVHYAGAGGGAGAYVEAVINSPAPSYPYAIGAGGAGAVATDNIYSGGAGAAGVILVEEYYV